MKTTSRRKFLNNIAKAGLGLGAISMISCIDSTQRKKQIELPQKKLPVFNEIDICVLGGSCTGVFAAIRAARLGATVAIIEKQNAFGGTATNSLVNIWHTLLDTEFKQQIIGGLTEETMERLGARKVVVKSPNNENAGFTFNSQELKIELDELVLASNIKPYLHTLFSEPYLDEDGNLTGVIVDNKSGRGIIKAKYFIDATGDGDLCHRLGLETYTSDLLQPPSTCALFDDWNLREFQSLLEKHQDEFNIPRGYFWGARLPSSNAYMLAGTRVYDVDCSIADDLTKAEIEGRRQIRAIMDLMRKYGSSEKFSLMNLPSQIGIRETRHIKCMYQISDEDALYGKRFDDAIANGSYRLDIHHQDKPGITFYYLDGTELYSPPGFQNVKGRWREETATNPTFYQVPLRSIISNKYDNLMVAGRMLDAAPIAYSGIRVMVNMNQVGEAAGVTSYLALQQNKKIKDVSYHDVRNELKKGGSIII